MENYAISNITDEVVTKGRKYPIISIFAGMINIDVDGTSVLISADDKDFTFYINKEIWLW